MMMMMMMRERERERERETDVVWSDIDVAQFLRLTLTYTVHVL